MVSNSELSMLVKANNHFFHYIDVFDFTPFTIIPIPLVFPLLTFA